MHKYTLELLQVQWRPGDPIDLYVMKPKGVKKPPVILYLTAFPTDTDIFKRPEYQELVTRDGVAAVGFVSELTEHRYHDRPMKEWFISELQESLATSAHDVQMVLNYLDSRGDLDMNRVRMFRRIGRKHRHSRLGRRSAHQGAGSARSVGRLADLAGKNHSDAGG